MLKLYRLRMTERSLKVQWYRLCVLGPLSLGTLAKHPLVHVERAFYQFNALVLAVNQEPNHIDVDERDLTQIQDFPRAAVIHF